MFSGYKLEFSLEGLTVVDITTAELTF